MSIPVAYAIVGVFHPTENPGLGDPTDLWLGLHLVQLVLIAAVGWMFWTLVDGVHNRAAAVVRALVLPYVVLYTTMDAVLGIAWGVVARRAGRLPTADHPAAQRLLNGLIESTPAGMALYFGSGLVFLALVAAVIAAHREAPPACRWLLGIGGLLFVAGHAPPTGPVAMSFIAVAVAMLVRTPPHERRPLRFAETAIRVVDPAADTSVRSHPEPDDPASDTAGPRLVGIVRNALLVIAGHVAVDSFVDLRGGVSPTDHLASGLLPLAVLGVLVAATPRLRAGSVAVVSGLLGVAVLIGTGATHVAALARGDVGPGEVTGVAAAVAALVLVVTGIAVAYRVRKPDGTRRHRFLRRAGFGLVLGFATLFGAVPVGMAYVVANRSGPVHQVTDLGAPHESVTLRTADGLALQAAYVSSRNGAAVIVFPGVSGLGTGSRVRMLVEHGYGVLVLEPRGQSGSDGDPHMLGWTGGPDLAAAIDFLVDRDDVESGRIGGLGLSVGGELLIQTAADDERLAAVVSEGAGTRWFAEDLHTPFPAWLVQVPFMAVATTAAAVFSDSLPPQRLDHLVTEVAPRPLLLIWTSQGQGGEWFNPRYHDLAGPTAEIWEIPESRHVGGLAARPQEYEERVVGFFDKHL